MAYVSRKALMIAASAAVLAAVVVFIDAARRQPNTTTPPPLSGATTETDRHVAGPAPGGLAGIALPIGAVGSSPFGPPPLAPTPLEPLEVTSQEQSIPSPSKTSPAAPGTVQTPADVTLHKRLASIGAGVAHPWSACINQGRCTPAALAAPPR